MNNAAALGIPRLGSLVAMTMSGLGGYWWRGLGYNGTYAEPESLPSVNSSSVFSTLNLTDDIISSNVPLSHDTSVIDASCAHLITQRLTQEAERHALQVSNNTEFCERAIKDEHAACNRTCAALQKDCHKRLDACEGSKNATVKERDADRLAAETLVANKSTAVEACIAAKDAIQSMHSQVLESKRVSEERLSKCEREKDQVHAQGQSDARARPAQAVDDVHRHAKVAAAKEELQGQAGSLEQAEARKARVESEIKSLQAEKERMEQENASLLAEKTRVESEIKSLQAEKKRMEQENASLQAEKTRVEDENKSLRAEKSRMERIPKENASTLAVTRESGAHKVNEEDDSWMWILKEVVLFVSGLAVTLLHKRYEVRELKSKLKTAEDETKKAESKTESLNAQIATTAKQVAAADKSKKRALAKEIEIMLLASKTHRMQLTEMETQMKDSMAKEMEMRRIRAEKDVVFAARKNHADAAKVVENVARECDKLTEHAVTESVVAPENTSVKCDEPQYEVKCDEPQCEATCGEPQRQEDKTMTTSVMKGEPATVVQPTKAELTTAMEPMEEEPKRETEKLDPLAAKLARANKMKKDLQRTMRRNDGMAGPHTPCVVETDAAISADDNYSTEDAAKASGHTHNNAACHVPLGATDAQEQDTGTHAGDAQSGRVVASAHKDVDIPVSPSETVKEAEDALARVEDALASAVETKEHEDAQACADSENTHAPQLSHAVECRQGTVAQAEAVEHDEKTMYEETEHARPERDAETDSRSAIDALRENAGNTERSRRESQKPKVQFVVGHEIAGPEQDSAVQPDGRPCYREPQAKRTQKHQTPISGNPDPSVNNKILFEKN